MIEQSPLTFRISLWRTWLLAVMPLALLAALGIAITVATGRLAAVPAILIGFAAVVFRQY